MSLFSEALKSSKLFTLPPRSVSKRITNPNIPRYQVIDTTSASAHRQDFGLKFPVKDAKTKQVEFRSFEDNFSTNGTSKFTDFATRVKNLEYTEAPLIFSSTSSFSSLNEPLKELSKEQIKSLKKRNIGTYTPKEFRKLIQKAKNAPITDTVDLQVEQTVPIQWRSSAIGATYAHPGVLLNTPSGVFSHKTVEGFGMQKINRVLVGGFLCDDTDHTEFNKKEKCEINVMSLSNGEARVGISSKRSR